jgi:hypothetical protein
MVLLFGKKGDGLEMSFKLTVRMDTNRFYQNGTVWFDRS